MLAIIAAIVTLLAVLATRRIYKKKIVELNRIHENELTMIHYKRYTQGRQDGFQEGREQRKIDAIRMFN